MPHASAPQTPTVPGQPAEAPPGEARNLPDPAVAIAERRAAAARAALAEAEARRLARPADPSAPREINGAPGIEPTLHGDWMAKGLISDF